MSTERLMAQLDNAQFVKYDPDGYVLAWFGGHGIHVIDTNGDEVGYWSTGDFANNGATLDEVETSMSEHMLDAEGYPC